MHCWLIRISSFQCSSETEAIEHDSVNLYQQYKTLHCLVTSNSLALYLLLLNLNSIDTNPSSSRLQLISPWEFHWLWCFCLWRNILGGQHTNQRKSMVRWWQWALTVYIHAYYYLCLYVYMCVHCLCFYNVR